MKRLIKITLLSISIYSLLATPAYAVEIISPITLDSIGTLINKVSGITTPFAVLGFIFCVIFAGWTRMTAAGNAEKEAKSMKIAVSAAIGFAIIALAPLVVKVLASLIGVKTEIVS